MAKVKYIGDPSVEDDHRPSNTAFGIRFPLGEPVDVTDERALTKLRGNRFFEVIDDVSDSDGSGGAGSKADAGGAGSGGKSPK